MRRMTAALRREASARFAVDIQYHVVWSPRRKCWTIERNGHATGSYSTHKTFVIRWAVHQAREECAKGRDVVVCVQQQDATFRLEWSHNELHQPKIPLL